MPLINYAEKKAKKDIDNRLKRYHLKLVGCCVESPDKINIHFNRKLDILKGDIIDIYGTDSIYLKAVDKLIDNCDKCIKGRSSLKNTTDVN